MTTRACTLFGLLTLSIFSLLSCGPRSAERDKLVKNAFEDFNTKEYDSALTRFDKLLAMDSTDEAIWTMRGRTLYMQGKKDEAIISFNRSIELNGKEDNDAYFYRGSAYSLMGELDKALKDVNISINAEPKDTARLIARAGIFLKLKRYEDQIKDCNTIIEMDPNHAEAHYFRGGGYRRLDKWDEALEDYNTAIQLDPNEASYYNDRGYLLTLQKKYLQALEDYKSVINFSRKDEVETLAFAYNNRGFTYHYLGKTEEALADINHSIELYPSNSFAFKNRAVVYISQNKFAEACADLDQALKLGFTTRYGDEVEKLKALHCPTQPTTTE